MHSFSQLYIRGPITFLKDDPGRQEIGSFQPITEGDWTDMAYIDEDQRLWQAIIAEDLDMVKSWLAEEGHNVNRRDHTGRTPLHLACLCSTPEIVQALVDKGALLVARLVDGRTALHIAAARGVDAIVRILLLKSHENEEVKEERERKVIKKGEDTEITGILQNVESTSQ